MSTQPKISVVNIMYNERRHIEYFLSQFAALDWKGLLGEIVILDGGSNDGTIEAVERWEGMLPIHHDIRPQPPGTFCVAWKEGDRRNWTLQQAGFEYILMLDTDEILDESIVQYIRGLVTRGIDLAGFDRINYFKNAYNVWDFPGERGCGSIPRLWKNRPTIRYDLAPLHCTVRDSGEPLRNMIGKDEQHVPVMLPIHHLHRMLWPGKDTYIEYAGPGTAVEIKVPEDTLQSHLTEGKVVEYNGPWPHLFYQEGWVK